MAASGGWKNLFTILRSAAANNIQVKRNVVAGVCTACGSTLALYALVQKPQLSFIKPKLVYAASVNAKDPSHQPQINAEHSKDAHQYTRERRFHAFASVQVNGDLFMTPQDFLESVTDEEPRPRIGRMKLADSDVQSMLSKTPDRKKNSSRFFRSIHNKGLISYTEYLFFLCILTKPKAGFNIAFNMFDADGNQRVDKKEFMVLGEIFRKRTETSARNDQVAIRESCESLQDTTLLIHLFGKNGKKELHYEDFYRFMDNLQTEVLEMEFLTYSHGMVTISEVDFARMLLKYTDVDNIEQHIETLLKRIPEEKGITFEEFRSFFQFLNNLEDFAIAMQMFTLAGKSIGQDEFKRAVKISTGHELSEHLVNTLFQLFDKDGDNRLSQVEFIGVMKDRIHRGFRRHGCVHEHYGMKGFARCVSRELGIYIRDLATHSQSRKYYL